jgi:hypothetical protein
MVVVPPLPIRPLIVVPQPPVLAVRPMSLSEPLVVVHTFVVIPGMVVGIIRIVSAIAHRHVASATTR